MGQLAGDLRELGYIPTEQESPFDEDGQLWTKGHEAVCDETGIIVTGRDSSFQSENGTSEEVYRYRNSDRVKMCGGYVGSYDWGDDGGRFIY